MRAIQTAIFVLGSFTASLTFGEASECSATNAPPLLGSIPLNQNIEIMRKSFENVQRARGARKTIETIGHIAAFTNRFRPFGKWDYKRMLNSNFEDAGNFHFGAVGAAAGFSPRELQMGAGAVTEVEGAGSLLPPVYPYGDQLEDAHWIEQGWRYKEEVFDANRPASGNMASEPASYCDDGAPEPVEDVTIEELIGELREELQADGTVIFRMHYEAELTPSDREGRVIIEEVE